MGDYYLRFDAEYIFLGFLPTNHVVFDIKNTILVSLRDTQFGGNTVRDP